MERLQHDGVLIVGAGLAGLAAALAAAPRATLVLSPTLLSQGCSSAWAQGGVAVALGADDTPQLHAEDTIAAGGGLVDPVMAALLAHEGPAAVHWLAELGAPFDRTIDRGFAQSLEAAHRRARVARVRGDQAGREIMNAVIAAALAQSHIQVRTGLRLRQLLRNGEGRIRGALVSDGPRLIEITAPAVVLATGGVGGLYAATTTPAELRGEGLALAALAGATIADPEFVQFHPTAIDIGRDPAPLATEALRGEGAKLINASGEVFMPRYHQAAELAPRDVVARAIHAERQAGRAVFLDARTAVGERFPEDFPGVFAACLSGGIDPRVEPIPVAPACHYHMGGILTDADGRTTLEGLYAAGECASTGVHGANRLASNSLLEAAVFGRRAGFAARDEVGGGRGRSVPPAPDLPSDALAGLRIDMSRDVGVVRDAVGLSRVLAEMDRLEGAHGPAPALIAARLIADAALARQESRGGHYRADYPGTGEPSRTLVRLAEPVDPNRIAAQ